MQKWINSKNIKKVLLTSIGILSIAAFPAFAADQESAFAIQPQPKDLQHMDSGTAAGTVSINYKDGTIATLQTKEDVVLEYLDESTDKSEWLDTGVTLTVKSNGDIEAPKVSLDSNCLNHMLRIKTDSGELSDIFYVNCNTYDKHEFPEALTGMTETEQYGYTAGDIIYLVPDLESNKKITEIRWQVSTNGGQSYKTFETIQPDNGDSLILQIDAECENTGNLYRYAVNPVGNKAAYSSPLETIVYEDYSIDGSTLTIKNAGPSGIMNDYKSGRLSNICPWNVKSNIIRSVVLENIGEVGKQAFKDFSKLKKIDFGDDILTIGEESFKDCTGLQAVTIPTGVAEVEKDAFVGCDDLREVKFEDPDTIINASENTIPQNEKDTSSPNATVSKRSLTQNEHSYPIIYGYKGIAKDEKNNIEKTSAGSTAYDYSVATGRAFYPLGAIDSNGYERPIKWDYVTDSAGDIIRISIANDSVNAVNGHGAINLHIPKTVDGHEVIELSGFTLEDATPICGKADTSTVVIPTPSEGTTPANEDDVYITQQPISVLSEDGSAEFTVDAENAETYSWFYSYDNGKTWTAVTVNATGMDTNVLGLAISDWGDTYLFHCVLTDVNGTSVTTDNVWAKEAHTHDETCYSKGGVRDVLGSYENTDDGDIADTTIQLSELYIPDTVATISSSAFTSASSMDTIYDFSKTLQTIEYTFGSDSETPVCYTYSTNYNMRKATRGYKVIIFDIDRFTGTTGDLTWTVDFDSSCLYLTGAGKSGDYTTENDVPYNWAKYDVQRIDIGPEVTSIGGYAFANFGYVYTINNQSSVLTYVSQTAFENVSRWWTYGGKKITTYINNPMYDAITELNKDLSKAASSDNSETINSLRDEEKSYEEQISNIQATIAQLQDQLEVEGENASISQQITKAEHDIEILTKKLEKVQKTLKSYEDVSWANFAFNWLDTTASCGTGLKFSVSLSTHTLRIIGDGEMTEFLSSTDVPWRPVNDQIRKVLIDAEVAAISNHAFNNLKNLRSVFNYGKNQKLLGGNDNIFDVIERHLDGDESTDTVVLTIPALDLSTASEDEIEEWYKNIETQAKTGSLDITAAKLRNWTLTCQLEEHVHTDSCYTDGELTCLQSEHTHDKTCYDVSGTPCTLIPGDYYIPKSYSSEQIIAILTGQKLDIVTEKYIVPVYTFGDDNQAFSDAVPP